MIFSLGFSAPLNGLAGRLDYPYGRTAPGSASRQAALPHQKELSITVEDEGGLCVPFPDSQKLCVLLTEYVLRVPQNIIPLFILFDRACLLCKEGTEILGKI